MSDVEIIEFKTPGPATLLYLTQIETEEGLEEAAGGSKPYLNPAALEEEHRRLVAAALQLFTAGGNSMSYLTSSN